MRTSTLNFFSGKLAGKVFVAGAALVVIGSIKLAKTVAKRTKEKAEEPEIIDEQDDVVDEHADDETESRTDKLADAIVAYAAPATLIIGGLELMAFMYDKQSDCIVEAARRCNVNFEMVGKLLHKFDEARDTIVSMGEHADEGSNNFLKDGNVENGHALARVADAYYSAWHILQPIEDFVKDNSKGYYFDISKR